MLRLPLKTYNLLIIIALYNLTDHEQAGFTMVKMYNLVS